MTTHRLTLLPKQGDWDPVNGMPKYDVEHDAKYFDLASLIRIYGEEAVKKFAHNFRHKIYNRRSR